METVAVEDWISHVQEICVGVQINCFELGIKSLGSVSEEKIKGKTLKLAFLKNTHHRSHISNKHLFNHVILNLFIDNVVFKKIFCFQWSEVKVKESVDWLDCVLRVTI